MPLSQLRTFTFPPPARLDEQCHGGQALRGAGQPVTNWAVLGIGAVRANSPMEPPGRFVPGIEPQTIYASQLDSFSPHLAARDAAVAREEQRASRHLRSLVDWSR